MSVNAGYLHQVGEDQFVGKLELLTGNFDVILSPCKSQRSNAPDMILSYNGREIGSARNKIGQTSGKEYVAIAIKHPQVTGQNKPLYANLGQDPDIDEDNVFAVILN